VTLAWGDNAFCGATFGSGSGLTDKGREFISRCESLGVLVDVSHASDTAFWDICYVATRPFVASHSNCRALCDNPRNLTDEMIRALAERGGVVGINLCSGFLSDEYSAQEAEYRERLASEPGADMRTWDELGELMSAFYASLPRPPLSLVADHVKHLIAVGGEDCVGFGGDLDGVDSLPGGMDSVADYAKFPDLLRAAGLTSSQVNKVCHGNMLRVFGEVLPEA
jgi:membrane dipeptidase